MWTGRGLLWTAPAYGRWVAGEKTGSNPTDGPGQAWQQASCAYRRPGDAFGGNLDRGQPPRCDVTQLLPLVDAVPRRRRGIAPALARRGSAHGSGLGVYRWVVERTLGWLVASVPPVAGALRAACGHPRGISRFGVFPHLFQAPAIFPLGVLRLLTIRLCSAVIGASNFASSEVRYARESE